MSVEVLFKTIDQSSYKIRVNIEDKISIISAIVCKAIKSKTAVKLIYAGKILDENKKLSDYGTDFSSGFFVVISVKDEAPQVLVDEASVISTDAPSTVGESSATVKAEEPLNNRSLEDLENSMLTGEDLVRAVKRIASMGFHEDDVFEALEACYNNPDRAVEYLLAKGESFSKEKDNEGSNADSSLDTDDVSSYDVDAISKFLQENPAALNSILHELAQTNPDIIKQIRANPFELEHMLHRFSKSSNPTTSHEGSSNSATQGLQNTTLSTFGYSTTTAATPTTTATTINITPEEREAIERLKALGFSEEIVVETYFACEKDENAAADFLLSNMDDDDGHDKGL